MTQSFSVLNEEIVIQEDVLQYHQLLTSMDKRMSKAIEAAKSSFSDFREPATVVETLREHVILYINTIIDDLSQHAMVDKTVNDYLSLNQGYIKVMEAASEYYSFTSAVTEKHASIAKANLAASKKMLDQSVHGLDFGIITNSLIDYAVYASMNKKEMQKQSTEATARFLQACRMIDAQKKRNIDTEAMRYYKDVFAPTVIEGVCEAFASILSLYIRDLDGCNAISAAVIASIDFQRSNDIVANLNAVSNKKGVFLQAIRLCPFNQNVYYQGFIAYLSKEGISLNDACGGLLDCFNLREQLSAVLIPKEELILKASSNLGHDRYQEARAQFNEITTIYPLDYRGWLGLLLCATKRLCRVDPDMDAINELYKRVDNKVTSDQRSIIEPEYREYIDKVVRRKKLSDERRQASANVISQKATVEALQSKKTQWLALGLFFAIMSVVLLIGIIATGNTAYLITLTLLGIAPTAVLFWLYSDSKKALDSYQNLIQSENQKKEEIDSIEKSFEKEKKLSKLLCT